ncbi:hypothetical protein R3P38DRAFT_1660239 [Favolaschia claudopus]|uniref:Uncharacterized protein n=1 Tax=Favolaschia claudopus TaxID=2862362 RepID=A0AAW0AFS2_9AGAR
MSSALTSDRRLFHGHQEQLFSAPFSLFHAAEYLAGATTHPAEDPTTVYAWDSMATVGQTAPSETCHGHTLYSTPPSRNPVPHAPDASLDYPRSEPSPRFWLAARGKSWRDSYSFAMLYSKVMITIADDPYEHAQADGISILSVLADPRCSRQLKPLSIRPAVQHRIADAIEEFRF